MTGEPATAEPLEFDSFTRSVRTLDRPGSAGPVAAARADYTSPRSAPRQHEPAQKRTRRPGDSGAFPEPRERRWFTHSTGPDQRYTTPGAFRLPMPPLNVLDSTTTSRAVKPMSVRHAAGPTIDMLRVKKCSAAPMAWNAYP
jgi:hypothetical protein